MYMNEFLDGLMSSLASLFDGNMGWAILLLALTVRLALLPLTLHLSRKMISNQRKIRDLQPQVDLIRERLKHDPQAMFAAVSKLYRQNGAHVVDRSSILGALVQLPIFGLLYKTVSNASATGGSFLWMRNLASFDVALTAIVLLLTGIATYYVPSASNAPSTFMVAVQIAITAIFIWKMSAGLGLYWVASSGVSVIQNVVLRREQKRVPQSAGIGKPL
jgi:YidC/Oxa1 family membrane protein insertase